MDWSQRLRLRHLELLQTLVDTGSLSETAKRHFTTQPGLSKWLKELEDDLGMSLFERHARGLTPTPAGQTLMEHGRRILNEMKRAQANLSALNDQHSLQISLGTTPAAADLAPLSVLRFLERYPKARVELFESTMNNLLERLGQGQLDVVIGRFDNYQPNPLFRAEMIYNDPLCIVARNDHPLLQLPTPLDWSTLCEYEWIAWPKSNPLQRKLDAAIAYTGKQQPLYRVECNSQLANLWMLQQSDMISTGSAKAVQNLARHGLLQVVNFELHAVGLLGMCWIDISPPAPAITDLLNCLREVAHAAFPSHIALSGTNSV
ncbi:MAG: LysR family transcriptional regulator [Pseudomonas sp.]|nr:LysR family transcriptional regulator [Pseudomonas sp.]